jgi:hypothetical protein
MSPGSSVRVPRRAAAAAGAFCAAAASVLSGARVSPGMMRVLVAESPMIGEKLRP